MAWHRIFDIDSLTESGLASSIDHTALKPETTRAQVEQLCLEAITYGFGAVCVAPIWVSTACAILSAQGSSVKVASVVGFPHGTSLPQAKALEARLAVIDGAREIDMVLDVSALKSGKELADVSAVVRTVLGVGDELRIPRDAPVLVKVIFETALLNDDEKVRACSLCEGAGAHMVKTSTGFASGGATIADVALMRRSVNARVGVKASGGIRTVDDAISMLRAGASRLGCSAGVQIISQWRSRASLGATPSAQTAVGSGTY